MRCDFLFRPWLFPISQLIVASLYAPEGNVDMHSVSLHQRRFLWPLHLMRIDTSLNKGILPGSM